VEVDDGIGACIDVLHGFIIYLSMKSCCSPETGQEKSVVGVFIAKAAIN
jgi:hypothetical protein